MRWLDGINGHGFGWTVEVGDGQGGLVCCGSWGRKESDMTEQLNRLNCSFIYTSQSCEIWLSLALL